MSLSEKGTQHSYDRHGGEKRLKRKANIEITCIKKFFSHGKKTRKCINQMPLATHWKHQQNAHIL